MQYMGRNIESALPFGSLEVAYAFVAVSGSNKIIISGGDESERILSKCFDVQARIDDGIFEFLR